MSIRPTWGRAVALTKPPSSSPATPVHHPLTAASLFAFLQPRLKTSLHLGVTRILIIPRLSTRIKRPVLQQSRDSPRVRVYLGRVPNHSANMQTQHLPPLLPHPALACSLPCSALLCPALPCLPACLPPQPYPTHANSRADRTTPSQWPPPPAANTTSR